MPTRRLPFGLPLAALALAVVPSMTASASAPPADDHDHAVVEHETAQRRLALAPVDQSEVVVVDAANGDPVATVELDAPASFASSVTEDGRYFLAAHDDGVSIIDGGVWSVSHGDHGHHYAAEPRLVGHVAGERPTHLISHDGVSALWFDGDGVAAVVDEAALGDGAVDVIGSVGDAEPHHGFAVPAGDDRFVVTTPVGIDDGLPDEIAVVDTDGDVIATFECIDVHGEASFGGGLYGAACADGILVMTDDDGEWSAELVEYPDGDEIGESDPYGMGAARAWAIAPGDGAVFGVGAFGTAHLFVIDPRAAELTVVDLGAQIATFGVAPVDVDNGVLVLTTDGAVQLVDPVAGSVTTTLGVVESFEEGDDFDITWHQLIAGRDAAYVSDPRNEAVVEIILDDGLVAGQTFAVGIEVEFLALLNG